MNLRMWYPNRAQWFAIWITTVIVLFLWIGAVNRQQWNSKQQTQNRMAVSVAVVGGLAVWMLSRARPKP